MILRKVAYFSCDFCAGEDAVEFYCSEFDEVAIALMEKGDYGDSIYLSLPKGWVGNPYGKHFCCESCDSQYERNRTREWTEEQQRLQKAEQ